MNLEDKAQDGSGDEVVLARDLTGAYVLGSLELVPASELGTDEFPKYGDFLPVQSATGNMNDLYLECPAFLAQGLLDGDAEVGDEFRVRDVAKVEGGRWTGQVSVLKSEARTLEQAAENGQ